MSGVGTESTGPKGRALRYAIGFLQLLLILAFLLAGLPKEAPPTGDLAVTFLGITNNPVPSLRPVRLAMVGGTTGLCAIFRVQNLTSNLYLAFEGQSLQILGEGKWVDVGAPTRMCGLGGSRWSPSYSCLIAVAWPPRIPTNALWRMVVDVKREPGGIRRRINDYMQREFFTLQPYAKHTIRSTEVDGSVPFVMPSGGK